MGGEMMLTLPTSLLRPPKYTDRLGSCQGLGLMSFSCIPPIILPLKIVQTLSHFPVNAPAPASLLFSHIAVAA